MFCVFTVIATVFQENIGLHMDLPGSLLPFKKEIRGIFRLEKAKFIYNQRFSKYLQNNRPVFTNRANLKKT